MTATAISIRGISKRYVIGDPWQERQIRELIANPRQIFQRRRTPQVLWALRDFSADIETGEVVGVVGRNGAGKSTLLKILSRITDPTAGEARVHGRLASLLEVGTGFHPELTGRENIFLNGSILGMSRAEIRRKFEEIVEFAEIGRLLDTPVKRYSSGMFVRLAFAVAAHVDPDILLVDEVLAVGDAAFQRKCLGRMEDIGRRGRTVVVVSHNMSVVGSLCEKVIWVANGQLVKFGRADQVISDYLAEGIESSLRWKPEHDASNAFSFHEVTLQSESAENDVFSADSSIVFTFDFTVHRVMPPTRLSFNILTEYGATILTSVSTDSGEALNAPLPLGRQSLRCVVPGSLLRPGRYFVSISEPSGGDHIIHQGALNFTITEQNSVAARDARISLITPVLKWEPVPTAF